MLLWIARMPCRLAGGGYHEVEGRLVVSDASGMLSVKVVVPRLTCPARK